MADGGRIAAAIVIAVVITVSLRAVPFAVKHAMEGSALLADLGRWMPLGALSILAVYVVTGIDTSAPAHGAAQFVAVAVTVAVHLLRRNLVLSLTVGTAAAIVLSNWVWPH